MLTMKQCIWETPFRLREMAENGKDLFSDIKKINLSRVIISGSGSSYHSGVAAKEFMQKYMNIPIEVLYPFQIVDYIYEKPETTLMIGLSQSGTSLSACRAMEHAKSHGCITASMSGTNDDRTILNQNAEYILTVVCGEEGDLQPKTKGMICTIANLMLFAIEWSKEHNCIDNNTYDRLYKEYYQTVDNMHSIIEDSETWLKTKGSFLKDARDIRLVGTHDIYGIILEGSLKLVETLRVPVSGYEFEEFTHGIYNAINSDSTVLILDTGVEPRVSRLQEVLSSWSDNILVFGKNASKGKDLKIHDSDSKEFAVFEYILPIFLICEKISALKGIDIQTTKDIFFHSKLETKILRDK